MVIVVEAPSFLIRMVVDVYVSVQLHLVRAISLVLFEILISLGKRSRAQNCFFVVVLRYLQLMPTKKQISIFMLFQNLAICM